MENKQSFSSPSYIAALAGKDEKYFLSLANKSFQEQNYKEAEKHIKELIKNFPPKEEYYSGLALIQKKSGNIIEAEINYRNAIGINPVFLEAYYNLGILLYEQGKLDDAVSSFNKAIEIKSDFYLAYYNLGNIYREKQQFDLSETCYKKAISLKDDFEDAYYNLGVVCEKKRDFPNAFKYYENTVGLNPDNLNAKWNKALLYLQAGDYAKGWEEYEIRKLRDKSSKRKLSGRELKSEPVDGKRILVYSEQGLGDSIQFVRYLKILKKLGAYIIFECKPRLYELLKGAEGIDKLIPENTGAASKINYDYYISLLSLPLYFNTKEETIPAEVPYLKINADKISEWSGKIKSKDYFNIGIAWSGSAANVTGKNRSCPLNEFSCLASLDKVRLYSLQEKITVEEKNLQVLQNADFDNFDSVPFIDTSALILNLDLVITVDTSIAHLAGALGAQVWTLLPYYPDWRWGLDKDNTPWYPTMKLFRQPNNGNWRGIFEEVEDELKKIIILKNNNQGLV